VTLLRLRGGRASRTTADGAMGGTNMATGARRLWAPWGDHPSMPVRHQQGHGAAKPLTGCTALQSPSNSSTSCCPCPLPGSTAELLWWRPDLEMNITCGRWYKAPVRRPASGTMTAEGDQRAEGLC